jgi:DNA-binding transcriptional LysR family regulator
MNIQHLKCLITVLFTGNFTDAGETLHLTQSAISKKIMSLESELGVKLIDRTSHSISLTPIGKQLMTNFIEILESYDHACLQVDEYLRETARNRKTLRIMGVPSISRYDVISLINTFSKQYPDIVVSVDEMETNRIHLLLQYSNYDLAFCPDIKLDHTYYQTQLVKHERFMIATSPKNSLGKHESVKLKDLEKAKLILNRWESLLYNICITACQNAGFKPNVVTTTTRPSIAFEYLHNDSELVYIGLRKTLLQEPAVLHNVIPLEDSPEFDFVYAWNRKVPLSDAAALFLQYAEAHTAQFGDD